MTAENRISVGQCVIPLIKGLVPHAQSFGWDFKLRSVLTTHAFDLVRIKRSWHSTKDGSEVVGIERVSVTNRYPACTKSKWRGIKVGNEKCNLKDD